MAARRTARRAVSVTSESSEREGSRQGGADPGQERLPLAPSLQDRFQELAQAALASPRLHHHEGLRAHLEDRVRGSAGQAYLQKDGQVVQVVPDVGDLLRA